MRTFEMNFFQRFFWGKIAFIDSKCLSSLTMQLLLNYTRQRVWVFANMPRRSQGCATAKKILKRFTGFPGKKNKNFVNFSPTITSIGLKQTPKRQLIILRTMLEKEFKKNSFLSTPVIIAAICRQQLFCLVLM